MENNLNEKITISNGMNSQNSNRGILGSIIGFFAIYLLWTAITVFQAQITKNVFDPNFWVPGFLGFAFLVVAYYFLRD